LKLIRGDFKVWSSDCYFENPLKSLHD
jgi:hypothetical protein